VLTAVAAAEPGAVPEAAVARAMALLRCDPRVATSPECTRLIDAVLSLLIVTGSSSRISADPDSELPMAVLTALLHHSSHHHIQVTLFRQPFSSEWKYTAL